ncbi:uncharacterized protein PGTG_16655 [Puccinia graminis f. sp. tritici CRL 75-36-700-3]|uniref:DUF4042 domain-containing protein n=1 Tax=Puccinia graminis f. sp. tritici (strain CRL 75-36-700-3 / race SCCL) TaxID=418459 RepID=E3L254_PUCGT|nr:uncharacterized protein PGTG_16655 [Puccinia graminis f. sp. tritici CRL 75-36-700-3]EFP90629.2 hypothetical protein PGTG_16655 [Puccinia graminis f. sp. tritici CRL 75-36-700-3]
MPRDEKDLTGILNDVLAHDYQARLKALRELKSLLGRPFNLDDFPDTARVSLAKSILAFPVTAKLASQVLLQIVSNSSPRILSRQSQAIIQPIILAFSSATQHLNSIIPSKDQLVKIIYMIRILTTMIAKAGSCALINLSDQIACIQRCYQPITPPQPFHPPERIVLGSQAHQKAASPAPRIYAQSSDSETNSEGESTRIASTNAQAVQCRLDALTCLRTMAQSDPKALHPFWPDLLPAHEYRTQQPYTLLNVIERDCQLMVRLRACSVMKIMLQGAGAYMAIAEENNRRVSYISLSAKLASITIELHRRLGNLLKAPVVAPELTREVLEVCEALTVVSAYHRISTPILDPLLKPMIGLLTSIEPSKISALLWNDLLKTALPFLDWNEALVKKVLNLQSLFEVITDDEEELRSKLNLIGSLTVLFPGVQFDAIYLSWVRARLREVGLDSLDMVVNSKSERVLSYLSGNIIWDLQAVCDDVRAIRLLGIIISKRFIIQPLELVTKVIFYLLDYIDNNVPMDDPDEKGVSTRTWTLANCLDAIDDLANRQALDAPFDLGFWTQILDVTHRLLFRGGNRSNPLKTNCVRMIGVALCKLPIREPLSAELGDVVDKALDTAFDCLGDTLAKVQWNAASALRQILLVLIDDDLADPDGQVSELKNRVCERLSGTLESSSSFKVRIQVCLGLQVARAGLSAQILRSITTTKEKLDDEFERRQIPNKEIEHAERLRLELDKLLVDDSLETPG